MCFIAKELLLAITSPFYSVSDVRDASFHSFINNHPHVFLLVIRLSGGPYVSRFANGKERG